MLAILIATRRQRAAASIHRCRAMPDTATTLMTFY